MPRYTLEKRSSDSHRALTLASSSVRPLVIQSTRTLAAPGASFTPIASQSHSPRVWGDSPYTGQRETIRRHAPRARDFTRRKAHRHRPLSEEERARNRTKSRVRTKAEHPLLVLKRIFGFTKVRYRGLHKNANRLFVACGLVNLYMVRRQLLLVT